MEDQGEHAVEQARHLVGQGQYREAVELLKSYLAGNPDDATAWAALGAAYFELANWVEAEKASLEVVRLRPNSAREWCNLGTVRRKLGRIGEAQRAQYRALSVDPAYERARTELAKLRHIGAPGEAERHPTGTSVQAQPATGPHRSRRAPDRADSVSTRTRGVSARWKGALRWTLAAAALVALLWVVQFISAPSSVESKLESTDARPASASGLVTCPHCHGSGEVAGPDRREEVVCGYCSGLCMAKCNLCDGTGWVRNPAGLNVPCYKCGGDGLRPCHICGGTGRRTRTTSTRVTCTYCGGTGKVRPSHAGAVSSSPDTPQSTAQSAAPSSVQGPDGTEQARQAQAWLDQQDASRQAATIARGKIAAETEQRFRELVILKVSCLPALFDSSIADARNLRDSRRVLAGMAVEAHWQAVQQVAQAHGVSTAGVQQAWTERYDRPTDGKYGEMVTLTGLGVRVNGIDFIPGPTYFFSQAALIGYYRAVLRGGGDRSVIRQSIVRNEGEARARDIFGRLGWD